VVLIEQDFDVVVKELVLFNIRIYLRIWDWASNWEKKPQKEKHFKKI